MFIFMSNDTFQMFVSLAYLLFFFLVVKTLGPFNFRVNRKYIVDSFLLVRFAISCETLNVLNDGE